MKKTKKDPLEILLYLSILGIFIGLALSIYLYKSIFNGEFSTESADWSALGSFIGGIFAPTVSFVTLVAILITIRLQKKMLETQANEFLKLHEIQIKTLETQEHQLSHTKAILDNEKIASYKQTIFGVVAQQIDLHQKVIDRSSRSSEYMLEKKLEHPGIDLGTKPNEILNQKEEYEKKVSDLANLSIRIATTKYQSIAELDKAFAEAYIKL
ncbi:hypothetical protein TMS3_0122950 [Pseudomonas taeanensis MS-3]|uniref:Uncharacterized protein n=1 Tax=Pseudomonas taeanensis MS-3 TaxID=1395571 RepID=A0A0A1YGD1_9PSED|nr:hypothetical protein [Pseudomonas taeanensis]KFX68058.1 hypothetical protein TMS3_0122950 [Pseudomonas taeanensis MS-3]